jgi:tryptophanyl-tRNA synthetase
MFNCLVTVPFLQQAHAYKDKVAKGLEANAGLFTYPMLMAADIVLYDTDIVPVGEDQRQHVEYAREAVTKFTAAYGSVLREPQEHILAGVGVVPGTDGQKMSKSYKNTIPLFGSTDDIRAAVMRIVTDSEGTHPEHVYAIHRLFRPATELDPLYREHAGKYKTLKEALFADIEAFVAPLRERRASITDADVHQVLAAGIEPARAISRETLIRARRAVGISL